MDGSVIIESLLLINNLMNPLNINHGIFLLGDSNNDNEKGYLQGPFKSFSHIYDALAQLDSFREKLEDKTKAGM